MTKNAQVRAFTPDDIPEVVALHRRAFGADSTQEDSAFAAYFREFFFESPWRDEDLPALVYEDGGIGAFLGAYPRPLEFRGDRIRAVVVTQLMRDPERNLGLAPFHLLRRLFAGEQDLTFSDGATRETQQLCIAAGGVSVPIYDLHWHYALRPIEDGFVRAKRRGGAARLAATLLRPASGVADAMVSRLPITGPRDPEGLSEEELTPSTMVEELPRLRKRFSVLPVHDEASLSWLFEELRRKRRHGPLHAVAVRDVQGNLCGWHIAYVIAGGDAEVLQVYARPGQEDAVVGHLLHYLRRQGAVKARGRYEATLAQALTDARARFVREGSLAVWHSRHPELLAAICGGSAFLSRTDAEWSTRFLGE